MLNLVYINISTYCNNLFKTIIIIPTIFWEKSSFLCNINFFSSSFIFGLWLLRFVTFASLICTSHLHSLFFCWLLNKIFNSYPGIKLFLLYDSLSHLVNLEVASNREFFWAKNIVLVGYFYKDCFSLQKDISFFSVRTVLIYNVILILSSVILKLYFDVSIFICYFYLITCNFYIFSTIKL